VVLAEALAKRVSGPMVVAGVPRGGLKVAEPVAARFQSPLHVVYVRKLTAFLAPEFAFGALDEDGNAVIDPVAVGALGLGPGEVQAAQSWVARELGRQMGRYGAPPLARFLPGAAVLLVDDGLATGLTMEAAVAHARRHGAQRVIVAAPCASTGAAERLRPLVDDFVCPIVDEDFAAVTQYYFDFSPVTDVDVVALLGREAPRDLTAAATVGSGDRP